jgi:hypothetical protein
VQQRVTAVSLDHRRGDRFRSVPIAPVLGRYRTVALTVVEPFGVVRVMVVWPPVPSEARACNTAVSTSPSIGPIPEAMTLELCRTMTSSP